MKIFKVVNRVLMCLLLLTGITSFVAVFLGYTHQWIVVLLSCVLYLSLWYSEKDMENDTRRK
ncbi:MAG: hypothetical protein LBD52_01740 [Prevotellaceae bacterium]|jgi:uncharacterized membrane protein YccC|nr:hypothetical protein [Prevotellaceae bacterium]